MTSATFVMLSGMLTFGVPLALAIRELRGLRHTQNRGDGPPRPDAMPQPRKPLPACLLPRPVSLNDRQFIHELADA